MKLNDMRLMLETHGIQLTKSLGQNFLHDANMLQKIASVGELKPEDRVLEVGPGLGPLTERLLASGASVLAIEKDERLCPLLRARFVDNPRFQLVHEDALTQVKGPGTNWTDWKMISNLPYSIASPLLVDLALHPQSPSLMVATLQQEVVSRICSRADEEDYGLLSLLIHLHFEPVNNFRVPRTCFFPEPDVESGCVVLRRRAAPLVSQEQQRIYVRVVKRGFSQRRKMMIKLLKAEWPVPLLESAFQTVGIDRMARAETIDLLRFVELSKILQASLKPA